MPPNGRRSPALACQAEIDQDVARYSELLEENRVMEADYQGALDQQAVTHSSRMQEVQATYDAKVEAEQRRYATLVKEREEMNARWNDKNQLAMEAHQPNQHY